MASDEFDHVIATNILYVRERIASLQSFRNAGLIFVAVELHLHHISLHLLLLLLVACLEFVEVCLFGTLLFLYLFAPQKTASHALVHNPLPEIA